MDLGAGELLVSVLGGVISAVGTGIVLSYTFGKKLQALDDAVKMANERAAKAEADVDALTKENHQSWLTLNRQLGQIEGSLGLSDPPQLPPPRKTRP